MFVAEQPPGKQHIIDQFIRAMEFATSENYPKALPAIKRIGKKLKWNLSRASKTEEMPEVEKGDDDLLLAFSQECHRRFKLPMGTTYSMVAHKFRSEVSAVVLWSIMI